MYHHCCSITYIYNYIYIYKKSPSIFSIQRPKCLRSPALNSRGALEVLPSALLTEVLREVAVGYDR